MTTLREAAQQALEALVIAEAGLADIGDADREPGDDVAWCEARAAQALPETRSAITALRAALGLVRLELYVRPENVQRIRDYAQTLDDAPNKKRAATPKGSGE